VVIDRGTVVATGTPDELKAKTGGQVLRVAPADPARMAEVTALMAAVAGAEVDAGAEDRVATTPVSDPGLVARVFRELDDRGIELAEFTLRRASLDEVFFALTGHRPDDGQDGKQDSDRELEDTRR
jgi:oleandomycin transport system ATP-binding protein